MNDPRYPHSYAAEYLQLIVGSRNVGEDCHGPKITLADARKIIEAVSKATGMDDEQMACALALKYLAGKGA